MEEFFSGEDFKFENWKIVKNRFRRCDAIKNDIRNNQIVTLIRYFFPIKEEALSNLFKELSIVASVDHQCVPKIQMLSLKRDNEYCCSVIFDSIPKMTLVNRKFSEQLLV